MNTGTSGGLIGPARLLHAMIRVRDLDRSLDFYIGKLGMRLLRRREFPEGRFTLAWVGYGDEAHDTMIELTHNWRDHDYALGTGFGHIALGVANVVAAANTLSEAGVKLLRPAGPLKGGSLIFAGLTHFV